MAGIFVNAGDGGVGPAGASNSFTPHFTPTCDALFYPNTCTARVTGAWLNAILSEIGQAVDNAGLTIDCGRTDNLSRAIMTHGQTVGYCGASRTAAESQKGGPLMPGDYWLNTSTGTVYVVDAGGGDWALPNQPAAFLCCGGTLYARCGGTYTPIVGGGGGGTIPGTDVTITACPSGPINADTNVQDAICTLSAQSVTVGPFAIFDVRVPSNATNYHAIANNGWTRLRFNLVKRNLLPGVSLNTTNGVIQLPAGEWMIDVSLMTSETDRAVLAVRNIAGPTDLDLAGSSHAPVNNGSGSSVLHFSLAVTSLVEIGVYTGTNSGGFIWPGTGAGAIAPKFFAGVRARIWRVS